MRRQHEAGAARCVNAVHGCGDRRRREVRGRADAEARAEVLRQPVARRFAHAGRAAADERAVVGVRRERDERRDDDATAFALQIDLDGDALARVGAQFDCRGGHRQRIERRREDEARSHRGRHSDCAVCRLQLRRGQRGIVGGGKHELDVARHRIAGSVAESVGPAGQRDAVTRGWIQVEHRLELQRIRGRHRQHARNDVRTSHQPRHGTCDRHGIEAFGERHGRRDVEADARGRGCRLRNGYERRHVIGTGREGRGRSLREPIAADVRDRRARDEEQQRVAACGCELLLRADSQRALVVAARDGERHRIAELVLEQHGRRLDGCRVHRLVEREHGLDARRDAGCVLARPDRQRAWCRRVDCGAERHAPIAACGVARAVCEVARNRERELAVARQVRERIHGQRASRERALHGMVEAERVAQSHGVRGDRRRVGVFAQRDREGRRAAAVLFALCDVRGGDGRRREVDGAERERPRGFEDARIDVAGERRQREDVVGLCEQRRRRLEDADGAVLRRGPGALHGLVVAVYAQRCVLAAQRLEHEARVELEPQRRVGRDLHFAVCRLVGHERKRAIARHSGGDVDGCGAAAATGGQDDRGRDRTVSIREHLQLRLSQLVSRNRLERRGSCSPETGLPDASLASANGAQAVLRPVSCALACCNAKR